jgi:hypothetical protein
MPPTHIRDESMPLVRKTDKVNHEVLAEDKANDHSQL